MTLREAAKSIWRVWRTAASVLCAAVAASSVMGVMPADAGLFFYRSGDIPLPPTGQSPDCYPEISFTGAVQVGPNSQIEQWDTSDGFSITADNAWYFGTYLYVENGQVLWSYGTYGYGVPVLLSMSYQGFGSSSSVYETTVESSQNPPWLDACVYMTNTPGVWSSTSPLQTKAPKTLGGTSVVTGGGGSSGSAPGGPTTSLDNLGGCNNPCMKGNPINAATGNKFQVEEDFVGGPNLLLALRRFYNSQDTTATSFGTGWRSTWHRTLKQVNATTVAATRADGRVETYTRNASGLWQSDPDVTNRLVAVTGGWRLTTDDDTVETYLTDGRLASITTRAGIILTLT